MSGSQKVLNKFILKQDSRYTREKQVPKIKENVEEKELKLKRKVLCHCLISLFSTAAKSKIHWYSSRKITKTPGLVL